MPQQAVGERVLLGDPLRRMARLIFDPDKATVVPLVGTDYINLAQHELDEVEQVIITVHTEYQAEVRKLVVNYKPEGKEIAPIKMHIPMKNEVPISCRPRRLSPQEAVIVRDQVEQWQKDGIIRDSCSEYSSNVVVVTKKDGSKRLCIAYQQVNKNMEKEKTPMPLVEDVLGSLSEAVVFSTIVKSKKVKFLGHVVEGGKISPSPGKTAALENCHEPRTQKQLLRFLGLAAYFRKFIKGYTLIAKILTDLTKKDAKFQFNEEPSCD